MKMGEAKVAWGEYLESLEIWVNDRGYYINFSQDGDNCICTESKLIEINSKLSKENQVYYLLHEAGHILVHNDKNFYVPPNDVNSFDFRIFTVLDESEAWKRAKNLAKRLNIPIDEKKWQKEIFNAIGKYIKWANIEDLEKNEFIKS